MGRLWFWWDDLFFRTGDRLVRLERRPRLYRSGIVLVSSVSITLAAHYLGLYAGAAHHIYSWVAAAVIGFWLTLLLFVVFRP